MAPPNALITRRHITRWVNASINKHFNSLVGPYLYVWVEGDTRDTREMTDFAELRIDGPKIQEFSRGWFRIYAEINILVTSSINDTDLYKIHTDTGIVLEAMQTRIPIFRYGTGVDDDQTLVGCFTLISDSRNSLDVLQLGRKLIETPLMTSIVEGHYDMKIEMEV